MISVTSAPPNLPPYPPPTLGKGNRRCRGGRTPLPAVLSWKGEPPAHAKPAPPFRRREGGLGGLGPPKLSRPASRRAPFRAAAGPTCPAPRDRAGCRASRER